MDSSGSGRASLKHGATDTVRPAGVKGSSHATLRYRKADSEHVRGSRRDRFPAPPSGLRALLVRARRVGFRVPDAVGRGRLADLRPDPSRVRPRPDRPGPVRAVAAARRCRPDISPTTTTGAASCSPASIIECLAIALLAVVSARVDVRRDGNPGDAVRDRRRARGRVSDRDGAGAGAGAGRRCFRAPPRPAPSAGADRDDRRAGARRLHLRRRRARRLRRRGAAVPGRGDADVARALRAPAAAARAADAAHAVRRHALHARTSRSCSARSRSTCSPCCSAARRRCCRSSRATSCTPARGAWACCAPRRRSAR